MAVGVAAGDGLAVAGEGVAVGLAVSVVAVGSGADAGAAEGGAVGLDGMQAVRTIGRRTTARWRRPRRRYPFTSRRRYRARECVARRRSILASSVSDGHSFHSTVRYFRPERASGLTVADVPPDVAARLGGLKQLRVRAIVNGKEFTSNTMPAGGGKLALSLNKAILKDCGLSVGDEVELEIERLT